MWSNSNKTGRTQTHSVNYSTTQDVRIWPLREWHYPDEGILCGRFCTMRRLLHRTCNNDVTQSLAFHYFLEYIAFNGGVRMVYGSLFSGQQRWWHNQFDVFFLRATCLIDTIHSDMK